MRARGLFRNTKPRYIRSPRRFGTDVFCFVSIPISCGAFLVCSVFDALPRSMQSIVQDLLGVLHFRLVIFLFASYILYDHVVYLGLCFPYVIVGLVPIPEEHMISTKQYGGVLVSYFTNVCIEL